MCATCVEAVRASGRVGTQVGEPLRLTRKDVAHSVRSYNVAV